MKKMNKCNVLISHAPKTSIQPVQLNRTDSTLWIYGDGENHILDLLLSNSGASITAGLSINLLVVRNDIHVIVQVMESTYKVTSGGGLGIFHHMSRNQITCASLYFALQRDIFPKLRKISPPPVRGKGIAFKDRYNMNLLHT